MAGNPERPIGDHLDSLKPADGVIERHWWFAVMNAEGENREAVLRHIERFIETGTWPEAMSDPERAVIALRLRMGMRIARALRGRDPATDTSWYAAVLRGMSDEALKRWLLIESWELFGRELFDEAGEWLDLAACRLFPPQKPGL